MCERIPFTVVKSQELVSRPKLPNSPSRSPASKLFTSDWPRGSAHWEYIQCNRRGPACSGWYGHVAAWNDACTCLMSPAAAHWYGNRTDSTLQQGGVLLHPRSCHSHWEITPHWVLIARTRSHKCKVTELRRMQHNTNIDCSLWGSFYELCTTSTVPITQRDKHRDRERHDFSSLR